MFKYIFLFISFVDNCTADQTTPVDITAYERDVIAGIPNIPPTHEYLIYIHSSSKTKLSLQSVYIHGEYYIANLIPVPNNKISISADIDHDKINIQAKSGKKIYAVEVLDKTTGDYAVNKKETPLIISLTLDGKKTFVEQKLIQALKPYHRM